MGDHVYGNSTMARKTMLFKRSKNSRLLLAIGLITGHILNTYNYYLSKHKLLVINYYKIYNSLENNTIEKKNNLSWNR